jgi:hypothetical protein
MPTTQSKPQLYFFFKKKGITAYDLSILPEWVLDLLLTFELN